MKNHAFLIQAHNFPELLDEFVFRIHRPNHCIFIHLDKKSVLKPDGLNCLKLENVTLLQKYKVKWGGISQVYATLLLLETANKYPVDFNYYHLLSEQDYLCKTNQEFDDFLKIQIRTI